MRTIGFFLAFLVVPAWADNVISKRLVDAGGSKAVVFEETVSPDNRYAIGWTIRPHTKGAKPVDWSLWKPDDEDALGKFMDTYVGYLPNDISDQDDYEFINCVIDLKDKKLLQLPTEDPDYPHKNRGYIVAAWGPVGKGARYALVESDARFSTENFWLITIDSNGVMHQSDIADTLQKSVDPIISEKRPLRNHAYETTFPLQPDENGTGSKPELHETTAIIPFYSDIPKSDDDDTTVEGTLTLKIPGGTVVEAVSSTERDDPFRDDPKLAKADHELNQIYAQLAQKLGSTQKAKLKEEQLAWIVQRDDDASQALDVSKGDASAHDPRTARDKSFLDSTNKRIEELRKQLEQTK